MDKALTNRVIILSFDCLSALDFPILQKLPHFQSLIKKGTVVEKVEPIYPSVTYPSHSTIVTGNYPNKHGVVSNTLLQPGVSHQIGIGTENPLKEQRYTMKHIKQI